MQLEGSAPVPSVRRALGAAACMLLAAGMPAAARAQASPDTLSPSWQLDATGLIYGEQSRTNVIEPVARIARLLSNGQRLWAQGTIDAMSGASPSGALPTGQVQVETVTSASGSSQKSTPPDAIPTSKYHDLRGALDLGWVRPIGSLLTPSVSVHASRETDYQSLGLSGEVSLELMHRLTMLTVGGGVNHDGVFPHGGTYAQLDSTRQLISNGSNPKDVSTTLLGLSRILTRRWMVGVTASRTMETGFLTEPYKIVSVMDPSTGFPIGQFTEKRPTSRTRQDVLTSSVYHLSRDILYLTHRYYWDDWGVRSNAYDVKYRLELPESFVQPHARFYSQTAADFYTAGFVRGQTLPTFASSDERLGALRTLTLGATYGFRIPYQPGEFTVRAEYVRQWGPAHPPGVVGVQRGYDLFPGENIGSFLAGYSVQF